MPKVLFASFHAYSDTASGAAASVRDLFALLAPRGWSARVLAGPKFDRDGTGVREELGRQRLSATVASHPAARVYRYSHGGVPAAAVDVPVTGEADLRSWPVVALADHLLRTDRPDVMVTFGGGWVGRALLAVARHHGVPAVFWLRNHEYANRDLLAAATSLCVPSEFSRRHWRERFDLEAVSIPSPIDVGRVVCAGRTPEYLTYVNPQPTKGAFFFAGILKELWRRGRDDVPVRVVESRGGRKWLEAAGVDPSRVRVMATTADPREFYSEARVLAVPSLWVETFGRVAAEAMLNGIPVLCSDRGALPETVGASGEVLAMPSKFKSDFATVPTPAEAKPWADAVERLFDDEAEYARRSAMCLAEAKRFDPEVIAGQYDEYLRAVAGRAAPAKPGSALAAAAEAAGRFLGKPVDLGRMPRWDDRVLGAMVGA